MNGKPLVAIVCCWIVGASILSLFQGLDAIVALGAIFLLLIGLCLSGQLNLKLMVICGLAVMLACGERLWVERSNHSDLAITEGIDGTETELTGRIASIIVVDGDVVSFQLKTKTIRLASSSAERNMSDTVIVRIKLAKQPEQEIASSWKRGDGVTIDGIIERPGDAGNFGAFDYRDYLKKQGIHWQLSAKGINSVTRLQWGVPLIGRPLRVLDDFRDSIGALMDRMYPGGDAGYMKGLVVGIRSDLNPDQFDNFARLGLTHVLAISGLHVGVVVFLLLQIGAWMRLTRERTIDMAIAMMPVYMMVTGASPSAVRACLMAMLALWLARRHALKDGLHLLLSAALLMLVWNPLLIEDVSFQLSFIVTAGLILFVPTVTEFLPIPWKWLRGPIAVTLTAQAVSFPLTVYYFHAVHLLSLPANFLLVPFISFIVMPLGMASIALGAVWLPLGIIPAKLATMGNQLTFDLIEWLNGFTRLRTVWPQPTLLWVIVAYLLMGAIVVFLKRRLAVKREREWWDRQAAEAISLNESMTAPLALRHDHPIRDRFKWATFEAGIAVLGLVWLTWGYQPAWLDHHATIAFINVGQGDSTLIRTGGGKHILIDTGGTVSFQKPGEEWRTRSDPYEVGRKLLVPLLLKRGVRELDALVLTHLDADHIGGAQAVLDQIPVRKILINGTVKDSTFAISIFQSALDKNIPCYFVHAPMEWEVDSSTSLVVLYPRAEQADSESKIQIWEEQNQRSIVLLASVFGRSFILPADLEAEGEQEIIDAEDNLGSNNNKLQQVDVLKAGHHGSKTSTSQRWLDYWLPLETVISVGRNNVYGHPYPAVLERLAAIGTRVFRTDQDGEIQYRVSPDGTMNRRIVYSRMDER
jgi:competence protein ComEC